MAGSTLCVSCASLPIKDRGAATKRQACPECKADIGMTAYGARFRIEPAKRKRLLAPSFLQGVTIGAAIFMFVVLVIGLQFWIDDKTKTTQAADQAAYVLPEELTQIPEVSLTEPIPHKGGAGSGKQTLLNLIMKIRDENPNGPNKQDGFLLAQMNRRKELRGMPFVMGDACRMAPERATAFQESVTSVRNAMDATPVPKRGQASPTDRHATFWNAYLSNKGAAGVSSEAGLAALSQILGPETLSLRAQFVKQLADVHRCEATKVLAKAAIFDPTSEVRVAAIKVLKDRPRQEYTEILMHGMRYPMPVVAGRAAVAMIMLDRKDLLPSLVDFLGEAAPGDPVEANVAGENVCTVREVVRINHHRNCLLCHAPAQTGNPDEVPGVIPSPGEAFPQTTREYYGTAVTRGEPVVRADTTYLRQDFSVMMPVENAAPWPEMQRFDFVVRSRPVEGKELADLQQRVKNRRPDYLSENHQAALRVLRELSGQDVGPTQVAWQRVIGANPAK